MSVVLWPGIAGAEIRQLLDSDLDEEIVVVGSQEEFFAAAPNCRVLVIGGVQYSAGVAEIVRTRAPPPASQ